MLSDEDHADDDGDSCTQPLTTASNVKVTICREKSPGSGTGGAATKDEARRRESPTPGAATQRGGSTTGSSAAPEGKREKEKKAKSKKSHRHQHHRHHHHEKRRRTSSRRRKKLISYQQRNLSPYFKNAALKPLQHPLEENIFTGLVITLVAVAVAFVVGIPVLLIAGILLVIAVLIRYLSVIIEGCFNYFRFLCSNRTFPASATTVPYIFPRDRLAFANDVRWLGKRSSRKCQSILHTVLIFEGYMELSSLQNFIQSRVLESETIDGEVAYPRLMEKLVPVLGGHRWEPDPKFDIKNHIFYGPASMKTEAQIQQHLGQLLTQSLPDDKPLWEIHMFPCYGSLRDTLTIVRVHQCLADGMTLVRILLHSLADQQQLHVPQRPNFASLSFGFNVLRSLIVGPLTLFLWFCMTTRDRNFFSRPLYGSTANNRNAKNNHSTSSASSIALSIGKMRAWRDSISGSSSRPATASAKQNMTLLTQNDRSKRYHHQRRRDNRNDVKDGHTKITTMDETRAASRSSSGKASSGVGTAVDGNQQAKGEQGTGEKGQSKGSNKLEEPTQQQSSSCEASSAFVPGKKKTQNDCSGVGAEGLWKVGWSASLTVPKIARIKQIMRSSFNDVLLAAAAGGVRKYLQKQGIAFPGDVKVVIPVDLRNDISAPKVSKRLGCKVASILAAIPSGIEAAIPRLWATRQRLDEVKASADPVVAYGATTVLINILPQKLGAIMLNNITDKASLQFCNLAGPTSTLMVGGFPLKGVYPIYPPSGKIRVAITVFTYSDQVHVTVVSHRSMPNFCQSLLSGMSQQVDQLSKQLSHRRVPGESRRSARNASTINTEITKPPTKQIHFQLQVVQEELQELSHKLDHQEPFVYSISGEDDEGVGRVLAGEPSGQLELRSRFKTLKTEFTELMGELRRRTSIVEGVTISFEDEEMEEEFRKPRKRALSVVSTSARRNSLFTTPRILMTPESSHHSYSSDENLHAAAATPPQQQQSPDLHRYSPTTSIRHSSSSTIRTTAV